METGKEVHSDIPKFPDLLPEEFGMLRVSRAWGYYKNTQKWRRETVDALEKRMVELTIFCRNPEPSPSDFVACLAIQRNLLLKEVLEALKGAGEQPK